MTRKWLAIVPVVFVGLALVQPNAAPAATYNACGVFAISTPIPVTCPSLPDAIAAATANPGPDTIQLEGGSYCPIELTGANGPITFVGLGFAGITAPGPIAIIGPEAEASTFTSHVTPCVDSGHLVQIDNDPNTITFRNVAFEDETASGVGKGIVMNGGFLFPAVGSLVLRDVIVKGNSIGVSYSGPSPGSFTMTGSTITGNTSAGIFLTGVSTATITNSTIADNVNRGLSTGNNYSVSLTNDTVTRNFIGLEAGGNGNTLNLTNTIISGNTPFNCTGVDNFSLGHNLSDGFCGTAAPTTGDQFGATPFTLAALDLNGGPTPTILPPTAAIGNGNNSTCPTTDQRGFARTDGACDVGAVEFNAVPPNNTPTSASPQTLTFFGSVTITFDSVSASGETTVTKSSTGPPIPAGFTLNGSYYEVSTTATFTTAKLCITDSSVTTSSRLLHYPGPTDVTRLPVVPPQVCTTSLTSFSPFAMVQPVADTTPPMCRLTAQIPGPPRQLKITVQDTGAGISTIATSHTNATVNIPAFAAGTTDPLVITATKTDQSKGSTVGLTVTDGAGNVTTCDPRWPATKRARTHRHP